MSQENVDRFVHAIEAFNREILRLSESIESIDRGELITELLGEREDAADEASGWYWRLERIPDSVESRYLYELLASNRVSLLKVNPTQDDLVPLLERALAPLVELGLLLRGGGGGGVGSTLIAGGLGGGGGEEGLLS